MNTKKRRSPPCPSPNVLRQLVAGELSSDIEGRAIRHVADCAACQTTLDEFVPQRFVAIAKNALSATDSVPDLLSDIIQQAEDDIAETAVPHVTPVGGDTRGRRGVPLHSYADVQPWLTMTDDGSIGQLGPYRLTEMLGRGGMGIVFRTEDPNLNRPVAVKVLSPSLLGDQTAHERFLREAKAVAAISHPAIVGIYEVAHDADLPYIAMEFVQGQSLDKMLANGRIFTANEVLRTGCNIATGLAAAHAAGLIHRDIKPANILIESGTGRARLKDFGLARNVAESNLTASGVLLGTPSYMAPETIAEQPQDERTDLFSLGAVMYHMLTGRPPFSANTVVGTIQAISIGRFEPIRNLVPDVSRATATVIEKLLSHEPADRYQTSTAVARALRNAKRMPDEVHGANNRRGLTVSSVRTIAAISTVVTLIVLAAILKSVFFTRTRPVPENSVQTVQVAELGTASVKATDSSSQGQSFSASHQTPEIAVTEDRRKGVVTDQPAEVRPRPRISGNIANEEAMPDTGAATVTTGSRSADTLARIRCFDAGGQLLSKPSSLHEAARMVPDKGVIQLAGNTSFLLSEPIDFEDKEVTIAGRAGQVANITADFDEEVPILDSGRSLTLRHLTVQDNRTSQDPREDIRITVMAEGTLTCTNCTFEQPDGAVIWLEEIDAASFMDCMFYSSTGSAIQLAADDGEGRLLLNDCLIVGDIGIIAEFSLPEIIEIHGCQTLNRHFLWLESDDEEVISSRISVAESKLLATDSVFQIASVSESPFDQSEVRFTWHGSENIYTQPLLTVLAFEDSDEDNDEDGDEEKTTVIGFTEWGDLPFTTEVESTIVTVAAATGSTGSQVDAFINSGRLFREQIAQIFEALCSASAAE
ncbi:MAG: serine/threonine protein kinase [Fuerstiella sp.]|nr:serine/threonine protein kinase [Fuerstiella sp.]